MADETQEEVDDALDTTAAQPVLIESDGQKTQFHPLKDQIALADRKANRFSGSAWGLTRPAIVVLPGTIGRENG